MNSNRQGRQRTGTAGSQSGEQPVNPHPSTPFLRTTFGSEAYPASTPLRREHVRSPPTLLTTSFGSHSLSIGESSNSAGYLPTPLSTSSLSSPFTQNFPASPVAAARGSSPMSNRVSSGYNAPYNPREWASGGRTQRGSGGHAPQHAQRYTHQAHHPLRHSTDDPVASPPPPYSPRRDEGNSSQTDQTSTTSQSDHHPTSAVVRPVERPSTTSRQSPRPLSIVANNPSDPLWASSIPPPPPPQTQATRRPQKPSGILGDRSSQIFGPSSMTSQNRHSTYFAGSLNQIQRDGSPAHHEEVSDTHVRPPASRRAVSANGVETLSLADTVPHSENLSMTIQNGWIPGMPLPPPPPGPPPGASRSQSASGVSDASSKSSKSSTDHTPWSQTRHQSYLGTRLGPIPPTPAGWVDEDYAVVAAAYRDERPEPLQVDTTVTSTRPAPILVGQDTVTATVSPPTNRNSMYGLFRSTAIRDPSAKGIRERRSESRSGKQREDDFSAVSNASSNNPWQEALEAAKALKPANLDLTNVKDTVDRKVAPGRLLPHSAGRRRNVDDDSANSGRITSSAPQSGSTGSGTTIGRLGLTFDHLSNTPPFSPAGEPCSPGSSMNRLSGLPPKALPTPPPQQYSRPPSSSSLYAPSSTSDRPISHLFHIPNDAVAVPAPLTPRKIDTESAEHGQPSSREKDAFSKESLSRYQNILERERLAESDADRLRLFTEFFISEFEMRRQKYADAWDGDATDLDRIKDGLIAKPHTASRRSSGLRLSISSSEDEIMSRPEPQRVNSYQPMLSPIAASTSNGHDEMSSRGRTSSRWWESQTGSSEGAGRQVEKRSRRESKYMGVPREVREAMQFENSSSFGSGQPHEHPVGDFAYGPDEYPPEKVGLHEPFQPFPSAHSDLSRADTPQAFEGTRTIQPSTPASKKLDVSRFVTLPPPYPRHYPAVQNHHPDLVAYRGHVRTVSDHEEISTRKREFADNMTMVLESTTERNLMNRQEFRTALSQQLSQGNVSFAEAAEAEAAFKLDEQAREKEQLQSEFDSFKELVLDPLQQLLHERIRTTSEMITQLQSTLSTESQKPNPNQIAEEGDEQAELLEKLTVLKWLFEARENLHREMFTLEMERNLRYRDLVTLPYKQSNKTEKLASTNAFFLQDEQSQRVRFETDVVTRHDGLLKTIEDHVARGVEVQLSAFWDIVPSLVSLLQKIPTNDLSEYPENMTHDESKANVSKWYGIQIPSAELQENPSYSEHPLQYLYSLLDHVEKSTYQFIEAQVNLLCLLHEVRCGALLARSKLEEAKRVGHVPSSSRNVSVSSSDTGDSSEVTVDQKQQQARQQVQEERRKEEETLTADLKERVDTVEGLWKDALGHYISGIKQDVKSWLISTGGWDGVEDND